MEGGKKPTLNAEEVAKQWPEFRDEKRASIGNDWVWETVMTYYHIYYNLCKPGCIDDDHDWFVIDHHCESINND